MKATGADSLRAAGRTVGILSALALLVVSLCPVNLLAQRGGGGFLAARPRVGDRAPDLTLLTLDGKRFRLKKAYAERPVVLMFGSYT